MKHFFIFFLVTISWFGTGEPVLATTVWSLESNFGSASNEVTDRWSYYRPGTSGGSGGYRSRANSLLSSFGTINANGFASGISEQDYWSTAWYDTSCAPSSVGTWNGRIIAAPGWTCCIGGCQERVSIVFLAPFTGRIHWNLALEDVDPLQDAYYGPATTDWTLRLLDTNVNYPTDLQSLGSGTISPGGSYGQQGGFVDVEVDQRIELQFYVGSGGSWSDLIAVDWILSYSDLTIDDLVAWYDSPYDVDGNGAADATDANLLAAAAGVDAVDCDANGFIDAVDIYLRPCWDEDLDGQIDYCTDPGAYHEMQCYPSNLFVGTTGSDANPGTATAPLGSMAFAMSLAAAGDTITVQPGEYDATGIPLIDGILIRSVPTENNKSLTSVIFNAWNSGSIFTGSNLTLGVTLEGLSFVQAGNGAVVVNDSKLNLVDCHFEYNVGGVRSYNSDLTVQGCVFLMNTEDRGGAIYATGTGVRIDDCQFIGNEVTQHGGALYLGTGDSNFISNSLFRGNMANFGSGGAVRYSANNALEVDFRNCDFIGNNAANGGAVSVFASVVEGYPFSYTSATGCLFVENGGATIFINELYNTYISGCTFANNSAAEVLGLDGSASNVDAIVTQCLFAFNDAQAVGGVVDQFDLSNVYGNTLGDYVGPIAGRNDGLYNFSADPLFCDMAGGNYTVAATSPCLAANSPMMEAVSVGALGEGCNPISAVEDLPPTRVELTGAYPNPFNPSTTISFSLPTTDRVSLQIFDLAGHMVRTLVDNESVVAGTHQRHWGGVDENGRPVSSGVYLYRLTVGDFVQARRMMLLK